MKPCLYCNSPIDTDQKDSSWYYATEDEDIVKFAYAECAQQFDDITIQLELWELPGW